jgi:hypothetical protein
LLRPSTSATADGNCREVHFSTLADELAKLRWILHLEHEQQEKDFFGATRNFFFSISFFPALIYS